MIHSRNDANQINGYINTSGTSKVSQVHNFSQPFYASLEFSIFWVVKLPRLCLILPQSKYYLVHLCVLVQTLGNQILFG